MHREPLPSALATSSTCASQNSVNTSSVLSMMDSVPGLVDVLLADARTHAIYWRRRGAWGPRGVRTPRATRGATDATTPETACARDTSETREAPP
eukprot:CAMPEP_0197120478 /NCGR_PEP_ID=MMETSP1390-20130617/2956_1 /TAXON_ID=38833 /ORGANISM="Micromonas sp., Strain CCMP2099" /LENGTH=94 /DNA_ID=CAMNT_0042562309 /DNA_START=197 /DNA_END=478 /DNA_ORIENTATION=+